ncbi:chaperone protein dnaJ 11, chloroplastic [Abrus precatorius]|uniref:Chaperone protein dnaJ 11, chloroplastic n=1 Tax=Abrus precatorius TaxID=3816 RepID=A0A8B8KX94_ABRPR|nr:chaperone protein dnaJ 11, chloroplastic [Abrus precatorius]
MFTEPFPTPISAATFPGKTVSSSPSHVKFRPVVSFATAAEANSTWKEEQQAQRPYLSPNSMASCTTLYEILGIGTAASGKEIKAAYRRLARVCHPDVVAMDRKESAAGEFMKIHAAYCTLSDPEKRASYDRRLFQHQRPLGTTSFGFSSYTRRSWETDQCW